MTILREANMPDCAFRCPSFGALHTSPRTESFALAVTAAIGIAQATPSTCTHTATMARNKVIEVSAKASSATARTMLPLPFV